MCGFAGEFVFAGLGQAHRGAVETMASRLAHRGPDDAAEYFSDDRHCAMGFRRLAVIDIPLSRQPMGLRDGSAVVAFNGEIYNFRALRAELAEQGYAFRTAGDVEVLLALWQRHGPEMLSRLRGMFAFAIHDLLTDRLFLARDRLGQKPLWYALAGDRLVFASEAKALLAHPHIAGAVDPQSLGYYLTVGYVPAPRSMWQDIRKLAPAHFLLVDQTPGRPQRYWAPPTVTSDLSHAQALEAVGNVLRESVRERLVADVPVGLLLSGGIDSSVVAALMTEAVAPAGGIRTFTAGFVQGRFDERPYAAAVARHLRSEHTELLVAPSGPGELESLLARLVAQYDEPLADSSALPTYLICRAAAEHVKVALTGDGGDEVFGGYDRYRAMHLAQRLGPVGWAATVLAGRALRPLAPHDERHRLRRLVRLAEGLHESPARQYLSYRRLFTAAQARALLAPDLSAAVDLEEPEAWFLDLYAQSDFDDEVAAAQYHDLCTYLSDDLMVKADIASMACSLELRNPMLDRQVVALGLSLPARLKIRRGRGKALLRDAFGDLLPPEVFTRRKTGFGAPLDHWLRNELRQALHGTLLEGPLARAGWFRREALETLLREHLAGEADHRHRLWALLWLGQFLAS